jgi:hypothetical protein
LPHGRSEAARSGGPEASVQLKDGVVDLMKTSTLGGLEGIGHAWKLPPAGEPFDARYGRW